MAHVVLLLTLLCWPFSPVVIGALVLLAGVAAIVLPQSRRREVSAAAHREATATETPV